jgi:hypothetical protein
MWLDLTDILFIGMSLNPSIIRMGTLRKPILVNFS